MRRLFAVLVIIFLGLGVGRRAWGEEYKLYNGSGILGDVASFDENGVVFKLDSGGFSERIPYGKFTQDTLKLLFQNPNQTLKRMVEPFMEIPIKTKPKPKPIVLKPVPRVDRPLGRTTFFSSFGSPLGLAVLALLYAGNLLAGYEVAAYRNRPVSMVCGLSAVLPLAGPLIFLASPTIEVEGEAGGPEEAIEADQAGPAVAAAGSPRGATSRKIGTPAPAGGGLKVAASDKPTAAAVGERKIYNRSEYTFNRRFIETQFAGFFRVVPSEAERDLVLVFRTPKHEYIGRRISRISSNDLFLQLLQGGGTKEVSIGLGEITQIEVRHKDDKGLAK